MATDFTAMTLLEISSILESGAASSVEITRAVLARIDRIDPTLHAFVTVLHESALEQARTADEQRARGECTGDLANPLHGVPIAVKDLCATRGVRTTCGTRVLANWIPERDATVVEKLVAAGAVIVGKTALTEGAFANHHPDVEPPVNPWNASYWTGVSSSGSGVAVAAGLCAAALGTDTGGSIRFPSAACGVTGLKPSYGRVSRAGVFPLADSLDHVGPMARSVGDCAAVLQVLAGHDPRDATSLRSAVPNFSADLESGVVGLRIGIDEAYCTEGADPQVSGAALAASEVLAGLGARLVRVSVPEHSELLAGWSTLTAVEAARAHAATFPARADDYGADLRALLERGHLVTGIEYASIQAARHRFSADLARLFDEVDVLLCPSMPTPALPLVVMEQMAGDPDGVPTFLKFTAPFDFSGSPTLSQPCGFTDHGLPLSLQLIGEQEEEALVCRVGAAFERATNWNRQRPPLV
jgi:amidase